MRTPIYLDHAATTPLDSEVFAAMIPWMRDEFANPSSIYAAARTTKQALEGARASVAKLLGARVSEIVWTSGGTESINMAIQGVLRAHPKAHWVTTAIEHDAVLSCREPLLSDGHKVTTVAVSALGIVDPAEVESAITDETVMVSVMLANNEIGTIQPVKDIAKVIAKVRRSRSERGLKLPIYLHTDACQAAGYLDLSVDRLGIDLLTLNASKIYGPKGSGLLYIRQGTQLDPLLYGGGQERGRRSGTENVAAAVGLATALAKAQFMRQEETRRLAPLRDDLASRIVAAIPNALVNGGLKQALPGTLNLSLPGLEGQALVLYLDQVGIMASTGSACSSPDLGPSHVLLALGRSNNDAAASLRLTLGRSTTALDLDYVVLQLPAIVARLREIA